MSNPAPGFKKHLNHTIEINNFDGVLEITIDGAKIAETANALILEEAHYPVAYYLTLSTIPAGMLQPSDHTTYCPFKGEASYYHLIHAGKTHENAVWTYRNPYDEANIIKDSIAIYPNVAKVEPVQE